jgi:hypothetical protein
MHEPRLFFDDLLSPFNLMPLLEFAVSGGSHTSNGVDFIQILIWNLYVAPPDQADLDVKEINFGF